MIGAHHDEPKNNWVIEVEGPSGVETVRAEFLIIASGFLSVPNLPDIPGLGDFKGTIAHTAQWPKGEVDLTGRVGIVGTAASGVQVIQTVAPIASQLTVFQRTANWCFPLRNVPMSEEYETWVKKNYDAIRHQEHENRGPGAVLVGNKISVSQARSALEVSDVERVADFESRWRDGGPHMARSFSDIITNVEANDHLREFWTRKIAEIVEDPQVARKLTPTHPPLTRRPPGNSGYYETFNRENVELGGYQGRPDRPCNGNGREAEERPYFRARRTCPGHRLRRRRWRGHADRSAWPRRGQYQGPLEGRGPDEPWDDGERISKPLLVHGPQSPAIHFSPMLLCVYQAGYFSRLIEASRAYRIPVEARSEEEDSWTEEVRALYDATLIPKTDSWWMGANIPGKPRRPLAYAGGFIAYRKHAEEWLAKLQESGAQVEIAAYGI